MFVKMDMLLQGELDQIRGELAALRQSVGKNRAADGNGNGVPTEGAPGSNMV